MKYSFVIEKTNDHYVLTVRPSFREFPPDGYIVELTKEKWATIVAALTEKPTMHIFDGGSETCAVCMCVGGACITCPLFTLTGYQHCRFPEYEDWRREPTLANAQAMLDLCSQIVCETGGD